MLDDFDRTREADTTEQFTFENITYVLDLTTERSEEFREWLKPWMDAAHERIKVARNAPMTKAPEGESRKTRQKIRRWAVKQGMQVSDRGVISREIRDAYLAAHGGAELHASPEARQAYAAVHGVPPDDDEQPKKRVPWNALPEEVPNSNGISRHMRDWAKENGHPVRRGGYVPADVQKLYHLAMGHQSTDQLFLNGAEHA